MDLITELENKFRKIEAKLESNEKQKLISFNYSSDFERTGQLFELKQAKYENELNQRRDEFLKELITKRDQELNQVNHYPQQNRAQLKALVDAIKSKHLIFAKGLASVYESILFRTKLSYPLRFAQLSKYSKLMKNEKKFCLPKENNLFVRSNSFFKGYLEQISFHILTSDLIFIYKFGFTNRHNRGLNQINMGILNHSGELVHFKSILKKEDEFLDYDFAANATNIITYNKIDSIVEIYNFRLELVHSIELNSGNRKSKLNLNNYEIALDKTQNGDSDSENKLIIICYNYRTVHTKKNEIEICSDENGFERVEEKFFQLVGVSDRFFFLGGRHRKHSRDHSTIICLLNREDKNNIYKSLKCNFESFFIYNAEVCVRYTEFRPMVYVYEIDENDSNKPKAIRRGSIGKIEPVLASENKYIYTRDINTSSYKQY